MDGNQNIWQETGVERVGENTRAAVEEETTANSESSGLSTSPHALDKAAEGRARVAFQRRRRTIPLYQHSSTLPDVQTALYVCLL